MSCEGQLIGLRSQVSGLSFQFSVFSFQFCDFPTACYASSIVVDVGADLGRRSFAFNTVISSGVRQQPNAVEISRAPQARMGPEDCLTKGRLLRGPRAKS